MPPKARSYITRIGTAVPAHKVSQAEAADYMSRTVATNELTDRKIRTLYRATRIQSRYSVLPDFVQTEAEPLFTSDSPRPPGTEARMQRYRQEVLPLSLQAIQQILPETDRSKVTHLITVSCTGMYAPGLDIDLVKALNLSGSVERTSINFMGCYAAFNALKVADSIVLARPDSQVLILCAELCSLHFSRATHNDQLLANSLFADGAAAVLVKGEPEAGWNLSLEAFRCELIPEGEADMAWSIGDEGFEMRLSAYVPELLAGVADSTLKALMERVKSRQEPIRHYALHPGGRRVLEALEQALGLPKEVNSAAYHVLKNYGNMSSVTVLFVLQEKLQNLSEEDKNTLLLSMAFGPGLTLESGLMRLIHQKKTSPDA